MTERRGRGKTKTPATHPVSVEAEIAHARKKTQQYRERNGRTQKESGARSGVGEDMMSGWERGLILFSLTNLLRHAKNEGVPLSILFEDIGVGLPSAIYEKAVQLSPEAQQHVHDMVEGLLAAELARKASDAAHRDQCA